LRDHDGAPVQPTRSASTVAGIKGNSASNTRTCGSHASNADGTGAQTYASGSSRRQHDAYEPETTPLTGTQPRRVHPACAKGDALRCRRRPVPRVTSLRHYAASAWLRAGIPINQVATWLGHTSPNTTLKTYAHVLGEAQDIAALKHLNTLEHRA